MPIDPIEDTARVGALYREACEAGDMALAAAIETHWHGATRAWPDVEEARAAIREALTYPEAQED